MVSEKKRHHRHYHLGGWVSPLCPMQFSPPADSPADAPADAGAGVSGDAGGTSV